MQGYAHLPTAPWGQWPPGRMKRPPTDGNRVRALLFTPAGHDHSPRAGWRSGATPANGTPALAIPATSTGTRCRGAPRLVIRGLPQAQGDSARMRSWPVGANADPSPNGKRVPSGGTRRGRPAGDHTMARSMERTSINNPENDEAADPTLLKDDDATASRPVAADATRGPCTAISGQANSNDPQGAKGNSPSRSRGGLWWSGRERCCAPGWFLGQGGAAWWRYRRPAASGSGPATRSPSPAHPRRGRRPCPPAGTHTSSLPGSLADPAPSEVALGGPVRRVSSRLVLIQRVPPVPQPGPDEKQKEQHPGDDPEHGGLTSGPWRAWPCSRSVSPRKAWASKGPSPGWNVTEQSAA